MASKSFYIYRHIRLDTNTPFYVGKGIKYRANHKHSRNRYWKSIVSKTSYKIEIVKYIENEKEAYKYESKLISLYQKYGYCEANLDRGGRGGTLRPEEFKVRIGTITKNRIAEKGHPRSKPVICNETGIQYRDSMQASKHMGLDQGHISHVCHGRRKSHGGYTFSFAKVG